MSSDHGESADKAAALPNISPSRSGDNRDAPIEFPPSGRQAEMDNHRNLFVPPARHGPQDSAQMMGPILRRKKVVSLPLGAGGDFFVSDDIGGPHRQHMTAHYEQGDPHQNRRKQKSEGLEFMTNSSLIPAVVKTEEPTETTSSGRIRQVTPPSGRRTKQPSHDKNFDNFMRAVVRRKQVSLDLLGPNDFFATSEEQIELILPETTFETEVEKVLDEDGKKRVEEKLFRPLRFSKPMVSKRGGGHAGGGHGGGHGGGGHGGGGGLAPIDEEVAEAFQRYSSATAELESQVKLLEEQLKQEPDKSESLRNLRNSFAKTQTARQIEETFIKSKLNLGSITEDVLVDEEVDGASAGTEKKEEEFVDVDDGIIRATHKDKIKAVICFLLMLSLTIVMAAWDTHLDEEVFVIRPVGLACVTDCLGNTETRDFFHGHSHLHADEVVRLLLHVDPNEPAHKHEDHIICQIFGNETGKLKATVSFPPPDGEERITMEERVSVTWDHPHEAHYINVLSESGSYNVGFTLSAEPLTPLAGYSEVVAAVLMCTVYLFILLEVIHRTLVAVLGSMVALMFLFIMEGGTTESIQHIMLNLEWSTLGLLFGMMLIVGELSHTGVFEFCAVRLLMASKGSFVRLIVLLCVLTSVASAFLDNVTTMLLVAPVTIDLCSILDVDPRPYLIGEVILSNIGGTATLIGDPPNIIIGSSFEEIGFVDFITNVLPCIFLFCVPASLGLIVWIYRYYLTTKEMKVLEVAKLKRTYPIYDEPRLLIAGTVTFFVIIMFFLHPVHHKDTAWIALLGAFVTIAFTNPHDVQDALRNHVEWDTLLFFAGLFVLVEACAAMGLLSMIGEALANFIEQQPESKQMAIAITLIIWVSAITSAFLDNIPYTATMIPVIEILASSLHSLDLVTLAWALSFGACLGGNGTLLGASANIVTAGISTTRGFEISFLNFLYPGMVVMIATTAIANIYMLVRYAWV